MGKVDGSMCKQMEGDGLPLDVQGGGIWLYVLVALALQTHLHYDRTSENDCNLMNALDAILQATWKMFTSYYVITLYVCTVGYSNNTVLESK